MNDITTRLHGQIMHLPHTPPTDIRRSVVNPSWHGYQIGHRDARHAAAELALSADAEIEALRKDAARYAWLRDKAPGEIVFDHTKSQYEGGSHFLLRVPFDGRPVNNDAESAARLDAAIDAALKEQK